MGEKPRLVDKAEWAKTGSRQSAAQKVSHDKKIPVFGMVERQRKVAAYEVPKKPQAAIVVLIDEHVDSKAVVHTDDA